MCPAAPAVVSARPTEAELCSKAAMLNSVDTRLSGAAPDHAALQSVAHVCLALGGDVDRVADALGCSARRLRSCPPRDLEDFARKVLAGLYSED
mmetsp:Transcript_53211/g.86087  ORF Transcript_53211/g.86087 Transcript_53211/m.86087 type:complete len:94 (+) Transcript_53211:69-350(+)